MGGRLSPRQEPRRYVVAYWVLLALTSVFIASSLLFTFLWGPIGLSDAVFVFWRSELAGVVDPDEATRHAARSSDRMVGFFRELSFASTVPLLILNVAWLVWGGLVLRHRRS